MNHHQKKSTDATNQSTPIAPTVATRTHLSNCVDSPDRPVKQETVDELGGAEKGPVAGGGPHNQSTLHHNPFFLPQSVDLQAPTLITDRVPKSRKRGRSAKKKAKLNPDNVSGLTLHNLNRQLLSFARWNRKLGNVLWYSEADTASANGSFGATSQNPTSWIDADWSDGDAILKCAGESLRRPLSYALEKPRMSKLCETAFSRDGYGQDISIFFLAGAYQGIEHEARIAYCRPFEQNTHFFCPCKRPDLCHYCSYTRSVRDWHRYAHAFKCATSNFRALTLSFTGPVPLVDFELANYLWDALEALIREANRRHLFRGGIFVKELAVTQFMPVMGIPHFHCLVDTDEAESLLNALREILVNSAAWKTLKRIFAGILPPGFSPDFLVQDAGTVVDLRNWVFYTAKPLTIWEIYRDSYSRISPDGRRHLNNEIAQFLEEAEQSFSPRDMDLYNKEWTTIYRSSSRVFRLGTCHWAASASRCAFKRQWKKSRHLQLIKSLNMESLEQSDGAGPDSNLNS